MFAHDRRDAADREPVNYLAGMSTSAPPLGAARQRAPAQPVRQRPAQPLEAAALFALALLAGVWTWWAIKQGAYFGVVMLPGLIVLCIGVALLARFAPWRIDLSLSPPARLALLALVALGAWAALSAFWSPAPDIAIADGQRIVGYAIAFGLGLWLCNLLGPRMKLALVPIAVAAAAAGLVAAVSLATGDVPRDLLEVDGTLDFPLGYRNANAAFFAIAFFPAVALAADRDLDWRARAGALATATLSLDMFLLCQSRASMPAIALALVVYTMLSPHRVRALSWIALAAIPAAATIPAVTSLYGVASDGFGDAVDEMNFAGAAALVSTVAALALGAWAARLGARLPGVGSETDAGNRTVARGLAALAVVGAIAFVAAVGDPIEWLGERADEFTTQGTPNLAGAQTHFSFNAGSDRYDAWRVALEDAGADPLFGDGGGGFQYSYLEKREAENQDLRDAHSVELEVLSELGAPGLALLVLALAAATVGVVRARRLGPSAAVLAAAALASGAYWLVHASVDWFWPYAGVTAPVMALLGAACAPAVRALGRRSTRPWRGWLLAGLLVLSVSALPLFLSQRYVNDAYEEWRSDLGRAYDDLDRAQSLDPLSNEPLLAEGSIARAAGDRDRALAAFREAAQKRPEEWATHYLLAEMQAGSNLVLARNEIRVALELNPFSPKVRALARRLGLDPAAETG